MSRNSGLAVAALAVAAMVVVCSSVPAADAPQRATQGGVPVARIGGVMIPAMPGYYPLRQANVQEELELLDEQIKKLEEIGTKYQESMRKYYQQDWAKLRELSPEERTKRYAEINKKPYGRNGGGSQKIEAVLLPHQIDQLKKINLRTRGGAMLMNPRVVDKLELDEKQQEKLRKLRENTRQETQKLYQQIQKLQQESAAKSLEVLTPKQRKQLEDVSMQGYQGVYSRPLQRGGQ